MAVISGCKPDEDESEETIATSETMQHIGTQVILPSYVEWSVASAELHASAQTFVDDPSQENLDNLRASHKEAWIKWQYCSTYEFGPASSMDLRATTNTFPADIDDIQLRIANENYSEANDEKGFPAIDYLINGSAQSDSDILLLYSSDVNAPFRKEYLTNLTDDISARSAHMVEQWQEVYLEAFYKKTGTQAGSALGLLVNELNKDYEMIKRDRIALPLGLLTFGEPQPQLCEAYYGGYSAELAYEHILSIEDTYTGLYGRGLDDLLNEANAFHMPSNQSLDEAIQSQLEEGKTCLSNLPDPLSETILTNPDLVENCYNELQATVVLLKTDMPSALGVSITFTDNDGD